MQDVTSVQAIFESDVPYSGKDSYPKREIRKKGERQTKNIWQKRLVRIRETERKFNLNSRIFYLRFVIHEEVEIHSGTEDPEGLYPSAESKLCEVVPSIKARDE